MLTVRADGPCFAYTIKHVHRNTLDRSTLAASDSVAIPPRPSVHQKSFTHRIASRGASRHRLLVRLVEENCA